MSLPTLIMLRVVINPKDGKRVPARCYECKHKRDNAGTCHISCAKPCAEVTGHSHGIEKGWFMYPLDFDPVWMTTPCSTFERAESVSPAVSDAVIPETSA